jgi:molybdopterin-guanine dinucleotide biosynthesis protein A
MILGAVLAGGRSTRFGSDKALAVLDGRTLLDLAVASLADLCDTVVVVGREAAPVQVLPDRPRAGMGPLGGLAAALHHADAHGYDAVLSCSVDSLGLDAVLRDALEPAPAYVASQPVIGLWPACAALTLDALLAGEGRHSMRAFADAIGARPVQLKRNPANINTPEDLLGADLAAVEQRDGL